jgi:Tfp pilus assembly protein PilN
MASINLLLEEIKPKGYVLKLYRALKRAAIASFAVFLILTIFVLGTLITLSKRINTSIAEQERLKGEMRVLEQTEQRLFLVKERLGKIEEVLTTESASEEVEILEDVVNVFPEEVVFNKAKLEKSRADVNVTVNSSSEISRFLQTIVDSGKYKRIELSFLEFDPDTRYTLEVSLIK